MRTVSGAVALAGLAMLVGGVRGAQADPPPAPFGFTAASLSATCADLAKGKTVHVVNETPAPHPLHVLLVPAASGQLVAGRCGGIAVQAPAIVKPGATAAIVLRASASTPVEESVAALLVAASGDRESAVLPMTISAKAVAQLTPLTSTYSTDAFRHGAQTRISIPIRVGGSGASLVNAKPPAVLSDGAGRIASLTYLGSSSKDGVATANFSVPDVAAGTYSGTVDLTPGVDGGGVVVTLTVRDHWLLALAVLLGGILVAFVLQHVFGVVLPRRTLESKAEAIAGGAKARRERAGRHRDWRGSTLGGVDAAIEGLRAEIKRATAGARVSISGDVVSSLTKKIEGVKARIDSFGEDLRAKARPLERALARFRTHPPARLPDLDERAVQPRVVLRAHSHLACREVQLDDVDSTFQAIENARKDVEAAIELRDVVGALWAEALDVAAIVADGAAETLEELRREIASVWRQAWRSRTTDRFPQLMTRLSSIEFRLGLLRPVATVVRGDVGTDLLAVGTVGLTTITAPSRHIFVDRSLAAGAPEQVLQFYVEAAEKARLDRDVASARTDLAVARTLSWLAVVLGVGVAVIGAITTLYVGKPWGSGWDYFVAAAWGLLTPTALAGIGGILDSIGGLDVVRRRLT